MSASTRKMRMRACPTRIISIILIIASIGCVTSIMLLYFSNIKPAGNLLSSLRSAVQFLIFLAVMNFLMVCYIIHAVGISKSKKMGKGLKVVLTLHILSLTNLAMTADLQFNPEYELQAESMIRDIKRYNKNLEAATSLDYIQTKFQCCGAIDYTDWTTHNDVTCRASANDLWRCRTPISCHKPNQAFSKNMHFSINQLVQQYRPAKLLPRSNPQYFGILFDISSIITVNFPEGDPEDVIYTVGCLSKLKEFKTYIGFNLLLFNGVFMTTEFGCVYVLAWVLINLKSRRSASRRKRRINLKATFASLKLYVFRHE